MPDSSYPVLGHRFMGREAQITELIVWLDQNRLLILISVIQEYFIAKRTHQAAVTGLTRVVSGMANQTAATAALLCQSNQPAWPFPGQIARIL